MANSKLHSGLRFLCFWPIVLLLLFALPSASFAQAQPAPLRVAIVGLAHDHVTELLKELPEHHDVELVGVAEADPVLVARYRDKYSLAGTLFFTSMEKMIEERHPQAVLVYTPLSQHRHVIEVAAHYGVSVLVEKPLTISLDDALAIRRVARQAKIHVITNFASTWSPANRALYDEVSTGSLGPIRRVLFQTGHNGPKEIGVSNEFLSWLTDPAQNGAGALYDHGCYGADLTTWVMHGETPLTVTAVLNHDKPEIYPRVDDDATIVLTYPKAQAVIQSSWNWPAFFHGGFEVYGTTGYAMTAGKQIRVRHEHDQEEQLTQAAPLSPPQNDEFAYLAAVVNGKIESKGDLSALDTNIVVVQILDAARESARTGKTVRLTKLEE
jgi:predicted dehydrogenase